MTYDEMIAVIQAAKEGKVVEWRERYSDGRWLVKLASSSFNFSDLEYRVKPEPRRIWLRDVCCFTHSESIANGWRAEGHTVSEFVEVVK